MAHTPVNLGTPPLGIDGDTAREAFTKVNANFSSLDQQIDGVGGLVGRIDQNEQDIEALDERVTDNENILALLTDPDIPHPTLALLFDSGLPIDPRITFTRASQATYTDALGRIQTADIDEPRLDYDPVTAVCNGLLMERAATNLAVQSGNLASVSWSATGATKTALPPDGLFTPAAIASGGQRWHRADVFVGELSVGTYAISWFFKYGSSGGARLTVRNIDTTTLAEFNCSPGNVPPGIGPLSGASEVIYPNGLRKITATFTAAEAGPFRIGFGPDSVAVGEDVIGYGVQLETGSTATSYIPTTDSPATRAADLAQLLGPSEFWNRNEGTLLLDVSLSQPVDGSQPLFRTFSESSEDLSYFRSFYNPLTEGVATRTMFSSARPPENFQTVGPTTGRYAYAYDSETIRVYSSSASTLHNLNEPVDFNINELRLGQIGGVGAGTMVGHFRKLLYFPRALSDEQLEALRS